MRRSGLGSGERPRLRATFAAALALLCVGRASAAETRSAPGAASGARTVLEWDAPEGCPSAEAVYQGLQDAAGREPDFAALSRVHGTVRAQGAGWVLALELVEAGQRRTRVIEAARCDDLADAAALAIHLALTAGAAGSADTRPIAVSEAPPSVMPSDTAAAMDGREIAGRALAVRRLSASFEAAGVFDMNSLSTPAWGPSAAVRAHYAGFALGISGLWLPSASVGVRQGQSVAYALALAAPHACYRWLQAQVSSDVCTGFELGRFQADGSGLNSAERSFGAWWLAPRAGLELAAALGQGFSVALRAEVLRPLLRERYAVNGGELVYQAPSVAGRLYLGMSFAPGGS